ncbi:MAG: prolyl-tRNA synthetase associated domain-containing protein [Pseudomonadota bacterium]|nr:prolyl-tRNA synthetase associated domain-containing protein [Pseudomonadota bacterium]
MPATRQELFALFDELAIETNTIEHIPVFTVEDAQKVHGDIKGGHCKNLFCKDEKGVLWLIVALEDARIDLKAAKDRIESRRLSFGRPELLMEILGVEPGSVTPFSLINDKANKTNVILDAAMMKLELLNFHPLKNDATTTISSVDLIKFIKATGHEPKVVAVSDTV